MDPRTFRPRKEIEGDWLFIIDWCKEHGISYGAVLNSFIPAIAYALNNSTQYHDDELYVNADFGDIKICKNPQDHVEHPHHPNTET